MNKDNISFILYMLYTVDKYYKYKNMKKNLLSIFCLMFPMVIYAVDGNHYNYVPKSPEAAAFDRVPDIPVSNYTGSLSFSIPIYTLECGDITLPITLDYQGCVWQ